MTKNNYTILSLVLLLLLLISVAESLVIGKANLDVFGALGGGSNVNAVRIILMEIRLPRTIIAALAGGGLALAGAILQTYLRNPLADSGVLGVSAFSSLGAVIAIYFGLSDFGSWTIPVLAILMAIFSMLILMLIAGNGGTIVLIIAGVILSSIAGGLLALALSFAPNPYALSEMIDWQIGGFSDVSMNDVVIAAPPIILALIVLFGLGRDLDAFCLGEETAQTIGVNVRSLRIKIIIAIGILVGAITSVCGIISFVGLIVPHILRPFVNNQPKLLLIPSFLFGAAFAICADILVRTIWLENELKLGVIMTLLGAPFFFVILYNLRRRGNAL